MLQLSATVMDNAHIVHFSIGRLFTGCSLTSSDTFCRAVWCLSSPHHHPLHACRCSPQGLPDADVVRVLLVCIMKSINMTGKNQMQIMQVRPGGELRDGKKVGTYGVPGGREGGNKEQIE